MADTNNLAGMVADAAMNVLSGMLLGLSLDEALDLETLEWRGQPARVPRDVIEDFVRREIGEALSAAGTHPYDGPEVELERWHPYDGPEVEPERWHPYDRPEEDLEDRHPDDRQGILKAALCNIMGPDDPLH